MSAGLVTLPGTELAVSRLCLGGNRFGATLDRDASFALLDTFLGEGGNFIDTAHIYADWVPDVERSSSEKTLGRWLRARGGLNGVVIATKIGHATIDEPTRRRLDAASLRRDVDEALANLGLSSLDLVYLHRDDPGRPAEDILTIMEEMRGEGLIRRYGASNWSAARLEEAAEAALPRGFPGFVANQPEWSLATRNPGSAAGDLLAMDDAMCAFHRRTGMAAMPYSAQAKGYFDKALAGRLDEATSRAYDSAENRAMATRLSVLARRYGATPTEVALHALTRAPFVTIPVVGCRNAEQVKSSFRSLTLDIPQVEIDALLPATLRGESGAR